MLLHYFKVRREAQRIRHLKRSAFLIEDLRTFFILSVWDSEDGLLEFGTVADSHVQAVRGSTSQAVSRDGNMEIWSTEWRLSSVSNNLNWGGREDWRHLHESGMDATDSPVSNHDLEDSLSGTDQHRK
jgi:hypothetical protein